MTETPVQTVGRAGGGTAVMEIEPILLDIYKAAAVLSLSPRKVYDLIYAGELETVMIGRSRRVLYSSVRTFVQSLRRHDEGPRSPSPGAHRAGAHPPTPIPDPREIR
ncbi:helix-turn-helix domain-containing protein [Spirillospora sp. NPDC047279]|uniref:helix-turn-helix domain-containing protein n=1 Tax=Spirillospora sp. NPDC047279 TaxID=3155478 RepID=UPI0033CACD51